MSHRPHPNQQQPRVIALAAARRAMPVWMEALPLTIGLLSLWMLNSLF